MNNHPISEQGNGVTVSEPTPQSDVSRAPAAAILKSQYCHRTGRRLRFLAVLAVVLAAFLTTVMAGSASAAVVRQASRAYGDCTMTAYLYTDARGVFAGAAVPCSYWHSSVSVHTHLQVYDASYWNSVESNHWRNITIQTWGPYQGYGTSGQPTLWTAPGTGCGYWRAETQMSLTNSLPTAAQYVATPSVYMCA
jgi:hypothetical protein